MERAFRLPRTAESSRASHDPMEALVPIAIKKLHPLFVAEIGGVDTGAPMNIGEFSGAKP